MVEPVQGVPFHPFQAERAAEWRAARARFARDADDIRLATRDLIDTCFRRLRSVDAAVQLLHSFWRIQVGRPGQGGGSEAGGSSPGVLASHALCPCLACRHRAPCSSKSPTSWRP